mgnify:FL=1|tara:strand:- start:2427 stop:2738 length:312 start_codon:yes stop_codon:yes gene_type:complete
MKISDEQFKLLRHLDKDPKTNQRKLSKNTGLSLGKINYCIQSLKQKGLIKIQNFRKNKNKINYIYILTPKGLMEKTKTTIHFMNLKLKEYDELQKEFKEMKKK